MHYDKIQYGVVGENILVLANGDFALIPFSYGKSDINDEDETFTLSITFYRMTGVGAYLPVHESTYLKTEDEKAQFEEIALNLYRQLLEEQEQVWKSRGLLSKIWDGLKNMFVK